MQNFYSFFVGTAHEGPRIIAVKAVSIDGQQVTAVSHCITKKSQMTIIDVSAAMEALKGNFKEPMQIVITQASTSISLRITNKETSPVETNDGVNFAVQRSSGSLNAQYIANFYNLIGSGVDRVHELQALHCLESSAFKIQPELFQPVHAGIEGNAVLLLVSLQVLVDKASAPRFRSFSVRSIGG